MKEESCAQSFIRYVNEELNDVKHSFIKIGFRLREADEYEYYKELGYENITDLAEAEFGFKKTTTYELMKVHELAHDPNYRMGIAERYDKYSYSQLLALTYIKYDAETAESIIKPTDSVRKIKQFVSNWNEEYRYGCGYRPGLKTVDEYLKAYDEKQAKPQAQISEYAGQLSGQIALEIEELQNEEADGFEAEFSERSEKSEEKKPEAAAEPMTDSELTKYCLKDFNKLIKFKIVRSHAELMRAEFVKFIKETYGNGGNGGPERPYSFINYDSKGYEISRLTGGKIVLTWSVAAGYISRMIEAGEYLSAEEQEEYERRQKETEAEKSKSEPEPEEYFSERSEKLLTVKKQTVEHLMEGIINEAITGRTVADIEDELREQTNDIFYSYHFGDLAEFITESAIPPEEYIATYCKILALLGIGVTE